jgi:hypothetical protein
MLLREAVLPEKALRLSAIKMIAKTIPFGGERF